MFPLCRNSIIRYVVDKFFDLIIKIYKILRRIRKKGLTAPPGKIRRIRIPGFNLRVKFVHTPTNSVNMAAVTHNYNVQLAAFFCF